MGGLLEPIVILGMPRSGSSMVAGIFHLHGCWIGHCHGPMRLNPKGFFENLDIKAILIRRCGRAAQQCLPVQTQEGFRDEVLRLSPKGKWIVKHSAMYRRAWNEFNPTFICVRRNEDGIAGSNLATGLMGTKDDFKIRRIIEAHHHEMDLSGGIDVFTDDLVNRDYASIFRALEHCGIEPDYDIIDSFVEPSLWGRWQSATA